MATIIDSHIHLWPQETCNEESHAWMTSGMPLVKPHLLEDYHKASRGFVKGAIYVETDVTYSSPNSGAVATWAKGPLDEIEFLRGIVEAEYSQQSVPPLIGLVPWAPLNQPTATLKEYLRLAEERAGSITWERVKGFRFLLQAITDQTKFNDLVTSDHFVANLKLLGERGFTFDVGVDHNSAGIWQLETMARAIEKAHHGAPENEKVTFVINHLCKPDFSGTGTPFEQWCEATYAMSKSSKTYMKFSGAFSEMPPGYTVAEDVASHLKPWIKHIITSFRPERVMFGSDWPVCNVKGPGGDDSWSRWRSVVEAILSDPSYALTDQDKARIWHATAAEAYHLE